MQIYNYRAAQQALLKNTDSRMSGLTVKTLCHIRLTDVPPIPEFVKGNVSCIRSCDVGSFLRVIGEAYICRRVVNICIYMTHVCLYACIGTVTRTGTVKMLEAVREFQCSNTKCGMPINILLCWLVCAIYIQCMYSMLYRL